MMRLFSRFCLFMLVLTVCAAPACAYIDPGTGSFVFQVLVALFVSAGFAVKTFWKRIKHFFTKAPAHPGQGKNE